MDGLQEVALGHGFDQAPIEIAGQVIAFIILSRIADQSEYGSFGGRIRPIIGTNHYRNCHNDNVNKGAMESKNVLICNSANVNL